MAESLAAPAGRPILADVAVVGAGPAGIAAAVRAAGAGMRVVVLDEGLRPGGQIWRHRSRAQLPRMARRWLEALDRSGATVLCRASVVYADPGLELLAEVRGRGLEDPRPTIAAPVDHASGGAEISGGRSNRAGPETRGRLRERGRGEVREAGPVPDRRSDPRTNSGPDLRQEPMDEPDSRSEIGRVGMSVAVHARKLILATGARERFLPFPGWTLPNVVGIGGAQALLKSGASFAGKRVVIAGSGPLLLPVAAALARAGARVTMVAEQARAAAVRRFAAGLWRSPRKIVQAMRYRAAFRSAPYAAGTWATRAAGDGVVQEVTLTNGRRTWTEACDLLCTGYGLVPSTELASLLGCALEGGRAIVDEWQFTGVPNVYCAGEPTGIAGVEASLVEGEIAALAAAGLGREAQARFAARKRLRRFAARLDAAFAPREELRSLADDATTVCRCEDVAYGRLQPAWSVRQAKLYTRAGMGPCQGRVCGPALEHLFGWSADTVRAPVTPVAVATLLDLPPITDPERDAASPSHGAAETVPKDAQ